MFNIIKIVIVKRGGGPLRILVHLPLYGFCVYMSEDGLNKVETCSMHVRVTI